VSDRINLNSLELETYQSRVAGIESQHSGPISYYGPSIVEWFAYCKFYHLLCLEGAKFRSRVLAWHYDADLRWQIYGIFPRTDVDDRQMRLLDSDAVC
jgi:hypothetical protein